MIILPHLLEHDLHRTNKGVEAIPLLLETPAKPSFVPAIVSTNEPGRFLISRRLTKEDRLRSAVFKYDPDRIDDLIRPMIHAAFNLSTEENYKNKFTKPGRAFDYIADAAGTGAHPHILLVPKEWSYERIHDLLGGDLKGHSKTRKIENGSLEQSSLLFYRDFCRVIHSNVDFPVFFSRPDYVGMYTQFLGGNASLFLHNVKKGLAFVNLRNQK